MKQDYKKWIRFRINLSIVILFLLMILLVFRAFNIQILKHAYLSKRLAKQYTVFQTYSSQRGAILDRNGSILAFSTDLDSVYVNPKQIKDPIKTARKLWTILRITSRKERLSLLSKLKANSYFKYIKHAISPTESRKILEAKLKGVYLQRESKRCYPENELACHVIGFANRENKGLEGLEYLYDKVLRGAKLKIAKKIVPFGNNILYNPPPSPKVREGNVLQLTIDKNLQYILETALKHGVKKWRAKRGLGIIMVPDTGEILAMALYPNYDLNNFSKTKPAVIRNRIVTDIYEPGSTFKVFLAAAALEERLVQPTTPIYCENGKMKVNKYTIHDVGHYKTLPFKDVIKYSSNIGMAKVAQRLGKKKAWRYLYKFGFGRKTGIDLPGESPGKLRPPLEWKDTDLVTISYGQGVAVTAIQLVRAFCAIVNGGKLIKPHVVSQILTPQGKVIKKIVPEVEGRIVSSRTTQILKVILKRVIEKGGTGYLASLSHYKAAGKTGTGKKIDPKTGKYIKKYISSFIGFAPVEEPRVVVYVAIDEPQKEYYGGVVAAPIFKEVTEKTLLYLGVSPIPDKEWLPPWKRKNMIQKVKLKYYLNGTSHSLVKGEKMPNLMGLTMREAFRILSEIGIDAQIKGNGTVIYQEPAPYTPLKAVKTCFLKLQEP